jgi:hypothetical protein
MCDGLRGHHLYHLQFAQNQTGGREPDEVGMERVGDATREDEGTKGTENGEKLPTFGTTTTTNNATC